MGFADCTLLKRLFCFWFDFVVVAGCIGGLLSTVLSPCVDHLWWGPVYTPCVGDGQFHKCGDKRCQTCHKGTFGKTIAITSTHKEFTIKQSMTCKTSNVVYCVTCTKCRAQYIGETGQEIHERQAGHLNDINRGVSGLPYVRHFQTCGVEHYTITGVEKIRSRDPQIRKARETFFKTLFKVQMI